MRTKIIIAGGRNYVGNLKDVVAVTALLESLLESYGKQLEIVSGGCEGADQWGEVLADVCGIKYKRFPADWRQYGRAAGPIRNKEMVDYADVLIALPGGDGTDNVVELAKKDGMLVWDWRSS